MTNITAIRATLQAEAGGLALGERSERHVCPFCSGGSSGEASFSFVKEASAILYNCFRASCGARGAIGYADATSTRVKAPPRRKTRDFTGSLVELPENYWEFFERAFGISRASIEGAGVRWCPERQRVWFPVRDERGYDLGGIARIYTPKDFAKYDLMGGCDMAGPKVLNYPQSVTVPFLAWYAAETSDYVLVEDSVSAIKAQQAGQSSIALLGTHLSTEAALYIAERVPEVIIALDRDATKKAVIMAREIGCLFQSCKYVPLEQDLKYVDEASIRDMVLGESNE